MGSRTLVPRYRQLTWGSRTLVPRYRQLTWGSRTLVPRYRQITWGSRTLVPRYRQLTFVESTPTGYPKRRRLMRSRPLRATPSVDDQIVRGRRVGKAGCDTACALRLFYSKRAPTCPETKVYCQKIQNRPT